MSPAPTSHDVLAGGGQMGALMRTLDWAATPLGPVETWPQSLRTTLSILLSSRHPIFVWWGRELVQFYNDGYRPILGDSKHPQALGQRGRECWKEIWDVIFPMISAVMERGESTFVEDGLLCLERHGYLEEAYFTYAYSPIRDESGGVGGVFCACSESTERMLSERRLETLRELSGALGDLKGEQEACREALRVLATNRHDVPFALLYLAEAGGEARLAGTVGLEAGSPPAPQRLEAQGAEVPWPWSTLARTGRAVGLESLPSFAGGLPGGPWPEPASSALALPLVMPGHEQPVGMLVVGISPRKALDAKYRGFLELASQHLATAVTNARVYEEERRRVRALAELDRAKTDFFSNVSHEFRTPLTLLLGPVEDGLADTEQPLPPHQRERQELVHRNARRLLKLVNQLLDFSRIEAGRLQLSPRPTDLATLTQELAGTFRSTLERAGLRLEVDCPPLPELVAVDTEVWERIVVNLLSNAFKFTLEGEVRISLREEGESVVLTVTDTGTGIPAAELPHLFERFHQVKGARGRGVQGSGIGLALIQQLVHLQGGAVEVQSVERRGSTFRVTLPRRLASPAAESGRPPSEPSFLPGEPSWEDVSEPSGGHPDVPGGVGARILIVDDHADMRAYIQRLLGAHAVVTAVARGEEALEEARARPPALILSDVMMPGMDGFALLRELRADPRTAFIPVILLSARAGEEASIEGLRAGADDYLIKPFSARELVSRIKARLEVARANAEVRLARARLHAQLMQAPVAMSIVTGPDFRVELANPRYLEMSGREDMVGRPFREAFPELPPDAPVFQMMEGIYTSGQPFTASEYPVRLTRHGQTEDVYFLFTCQPMRDVTGDVVGLMTVAVDVTAQVLARQQVERLATSERELRARAEDADQRKDEFLAMLAHELRNPLAALNSALEMMRPCRRGRGPARPPARHLHAPGGQPRAHGG